MNEHLYFVRMNLGPSNMTHKEKREPKFLDTSQLKIHETRGEGSVQMVRDRTRVEVEFSNDEVDRNWGDRRGLNPRHSLNPWCLADLVSLCEF